jgi:hypothetical protein
MSSLCLECGAQLIPCSVAMPIGPPNNEGSDMERGQLTLEGIFGLSFCENCGLLGPVHLHDAKKLTRNLRFGRD